MSGKSGEPPHKKIRSSASKFACLPAELWGRTATFLNLTDEENEVMPILLALAPVAKDGSIARTIKHWYLKDNAAYLRDYLYEQIKRFAPLSKERTKVISASLKYWLELNPGWKTALNPYGGEDEKNSLSDQFITDNSFDLKQPDVDSALIMSACAFESSSGHFSMDQRDERYFMLEAPVELFEEEFVPGSIFVGIDGVDVRTMPYGEICLMLIKQKERTKIKVMAECIEFFFLNPATAIDFGLFDVLRFIVEDVGVDCSHEYRGVHFNSDEVWGVPLITHGLAQPDPRFLGYLLSVDNVNPNAIVYIDFADDADDENGPTLLHMMGSYNPIFEELQKSIEPIALIKRLETLLQHTKVDVNAENEHGRTPLFTIFRKMNKLNFDYRNHVLSSKDSKRKFYRYKEIELYVVKALLDAGASTESVDIDLLPDQEEHNRGTMAKLVEAEDKAARDAIIAGLSSTEV